MGTNGSELQCKLMEYHADLAKEATGCLVSAPALPGILSPGRLSPEKQYLRREQQREGESVYEDLSCPHWSKIESSGIDSQLRSVNLW